MNELKKSIMLPVDKKNIIFWCIICGIIVILVIALWDNENNHSKIQLTQFTTKEVVPIGANEFRLIVEYCKGINNNAIGMVINSKIEEIPIPVNQNSKTGCEVYGAKIHSDSVNTISVKLLNKDKLFDLVKNLENKRHYLNDQWIKLHQKLIQEQKSINQNNEKIDSLKSQIHEIQSLLKSNRSSLISSIALT